MGTLSDNDNLKNIKMLKINRTNYPVLDIKGIEHYQCDQSKWSIYDEYRPFWIAGTSHHQEDTKRFIEGEYKSLEVRHEPLEKFPHALAVYGTWTEKDQQDCYDFKEKMLGYIPDWLAKQIFEIIGELNSQNKDILIIPNVFDINRESNSIKIDLQLFTAK